jgi:hypothetical protein
LNVVLQHLASNYTFPNYKLYYIVNPVNEGKVLTISQIVLQDRLANNWKDTDDGHKVLTISQIVLQDRLANNWKDTEDIEMLALMRYCQYSVSIAVYICISS